MTRHRNIILVLAIMTLLVTTGNSYPQEREAPIASIGHDSSVNSVVFSPNGRLILSGSSDKTVKLWDIRSRRLLRTLEGHTDSVTCIAFSPGDARIAASGGSDATIRIWDIVDGRELKVIHGHKNYVASIAFSPNGRMIVSGGGAGPHAPYMDKVVRLWDVSTGNLLRTFEGHTGSIKCVAFTPNGDQILSAAGYFDFTIRVWNTIDGELLRVLKGHQSPIECLVISPDGSKAVTGVDIQNGPTPFIIWDLNKGSLFRRLKGMGGAHVSAAFSPDGKYLALGEGDGIFAVVKTQDYSLFYLYGLKRISENPVRSVSADPTSHVKSIAFSPDSNSIVAGHEDSKIKLWNVAMNELIGTFPSQSEKEVRSENSEPSNTEINNVFYDPKTGLEWFAGPNRDMNWYRARDWVSNLEIGGGNWRMPTRRELQGIYGQYDSSKFIDTDEADFVWSGDKNAQNEAYRLNFYNGSIHSIPCGRSLMHRAIAVRRPPK